MAIKRIDPSVGFKPKATLKTLPGEPQETETERLIRDLKSITYPNPLEVKTLKFLEANKETLIDEEDVTYSPLEHNVIVEMPKQTAEKLYSLLGHVRRQDGFNDLFKAFNEANFPMLRPSLHIDLVSPGVLRVETDSVYRTRTRSR